MEPIYFGSTNMSKLYAGGGEISKVYFGNDEVYSNYSLPLFSYVANTSSINMGTQTLAVNNGYFYVGGGVTPRLRRFNEENLAYVNGASTNITSTVNAIAINNGFIYVADNAAIRKFYESNLGFVGNTATFGSTIVDIAVGLGNIFVIGASNKQIVKYRESNLTQSASVNMNTADSSPVYGSIKLQNNLVYVGGEFGTNAQIHKHYAANLVEIGNTPTGVVADVGEIAISNGYLYLGTVNGTSSYVYKYDDSDLSLVGNTASYGGNIITILTYDGHLYVGGGTNRRLKKYSENNLAFVAETNAYGGTGNIIQKVISNNNHLFYGGTGGLNIVYKYTK
jgi:hypothetical protein